jgi:hypothetical protein
MTIFSTSRDMALFHVEYSFVNICIIPRGIIMEVSGFRNGNRELFLNLSAFHVERQYS